MITLECFNKKELKALLDSERFRTMAHIPISEMRGHSQAVNPDAADDDILLIIAFESKMVAGYLGILPSALQFSSNDHSKCGWFSCLWVDESQRGNGVSKTMMTKALELWKNQVLLAEYVPATKKMYEAFGGFESYDVSGIRLYIRSDFGTLLPPKHKVFMRTKGLIKGLDLALNVIFDLRFQFKKNLSHFTFKEIKSIDSELTNFIKNTSGNELFPRNIEALQWLIDNPWVRSGKVKTESEKKYYFTSVAKRFEFRPIVVRDSDGNTVAFFIFALRDNHLRIPYLYSPLDGNALADIVYHFISKWQIGTLSTYQKTIASALLKKRFPAFYAKDLSRGFMIYEDLMSQIDWSTNPQIQDGAGDCAFT